jgi:bifunctional DNase/RNase
MHNINETDTLVHMKDANKASALCVLQDVNEADATKSTVANVDPRRQTSFVLYSTHKVKARLTP